MAELLKTGLKPAIKPSVCRSGETSNQQFVRCGRFIRHSNLWYFKTREGINYGPFDSQTECKYAYEEFIDVVANQTDLGGLAIDFQETNANSESDWKIPDISFF